MDVGKITLDKTNDLKSVDGHIQCNKDVNCNVNHFQKLYEVNENESLGRHLVATRSIRQDELVMREKCLVWGPHKLTAPVCLGCGKAVTAETSTPCVKCGWPVCSDECQHSKAHIPECYYTQKKGTKMTITNFVYPHASYQCITALRVLYLRDHDKDLWDRLMKLESHCARRKGTQTYEDDKVFVAQFIREFFNLENVFTEKEILKVCGMIQINGYNAPLGYVTIYEEAAKFEHSCRANCAKTFTKDGELILTAVDNISKGEHLSECYCESLWGTTQRRDFLYETNYFACSCKRCTNRSEFGTHFNSLKCQSTEICTGFVLPDNFQGSPSKESDDIWNCSVCDFVLTPIRVKNILAAAEKDLKAINGNSEKCLKFLEDYKHILHENHYYMTEVNVILCKLLGNENESGIMTLSDKLLEFKMDLCQTILDLVKIIAPADLRLRGTLLFEKHLAIAETLRRQSKLLNLAESLVMLQRSKNILQEVVEVIKYEPKESPEGKILIQARKDLDKINNLLRRPGVTNEG